MRVESSVPSPFILLYSLSAKKPGRPRAHNTGGGRGGGREGRREGRREGGREEGREGGREGRRKRMRRKFTETGASRKCSPWLTLQCYTFNTSVYMHE